MYCDMNFCHKQWPNKYWCRWWWWWWCNIADGHWTVFVRKLERTSERTSRQDSSSRQHAHLDAGLSFCPFL